MALLPTFVTALLGKQGTPLRELRDTAERDRQRKRAASQAAQQEEQMLLSSIYGGGGMRVDGGATVTLKNDAAVHSNTAAVCHMLAVLCGWL